MLFAVAIGIGGGLAEGVRAIWRQRVAYFPTGQFASPEVLWMAPLAAVTTLAVLGLLIIAVDRVARARGRVLAFAPALFTVVTGYSFLRGSRLGIANISAVILAIGVAAVVARIVAARPAPMRRLVRVATPVMVAVLAAWAAAVSSSDK